MRAFPLVAALLLSAACSSSPSASSPDTGHKLAGRDAASDITPPDADEVWAPDAQAPLPPDAAAAILPDAATPPDSGSSWPPGSFLAKCNGAPTTLSGAARAPNGIDPVDKALIEVWDQAPAPLPTGVSCQGCASSDALVSSFAGVDGTFTLSLDTLPEKSSYVVTVRKAGFRRTIPSVATAACQDTTLGTVTLPGRAADGDLPKIAVASGNKDHLEHVLSAMGVSEYDCFRGLPANSSSETCNGPYTLGDLLSNLDTMKQYSMIFIACAPSDAYEPTSPADPAALNLHDWVALGGKLVVTDMSYDFVEQPFPDAIEFQGADAPDAGLPQPQNTAEIGTSGSCTSGNVADPDLAAWLGNFNPGTIDASGNVPLQGFLSKWAVQKSAGDGTTVIVSGQASWSGGSGVVPLTSQFEVESCGRVIFSSYHTSGTGSTLLPQERILEYLMLQVGMCVGPQ